MIKISSHELKYTSPIDIDYDPINFVLSKGEKRLGGGGYHPGRAMTMIMRLGNKSQVNEIIKLNKSFAVEKENYILYPYKFNFAIHNNPNDVIKADWFSGLSQGLALMAYCRHNDKPLVDKILNSFESKEICEITENGYHYMEYPGHCDALNGHIYALYGIYEYWHLHQTEKSLFLLEQGIEWVRHNLHLYRNPNNASFYCVNHKVLCDKRDGKYHKVHIEQLNYLHLITGDRWFKEQADLFLQDFGDNL